MNELDLLEDVITKFADPSVAPTLNWDVAAWALFSGIEPPAKDEEKPRLAAHLTCCKGAQLLSETKAPFPKSENARYQAETMVVQALEVGHAANLLMGSVRRVASAMTEQALGLRDPLRPDALGTITNLAGKLKKLIPGVHPLQFPRCPELEELQKISPDAACRLKKAIRTGYDSAFPAPQGTAPTPNG